MAQQDYYELLVLKKGASADEIKNAYRKLAVKYHPDKNPGDKKAEDRFKEINEAYAVLSDPQKKAQYDQFGHAGVTGAGFSSGGFGGFGAGSPFGDIFGDIFGEIFGGGGGGRGARRWRPGGAGAGVGAADGRGGRRAGRGARCWR